LLENQVLADHMASAGEEESLGIESAQAFFRGRKEHVMQVSFKE